MVRGTTAISNPNKIPFPYVAFGNNLYHSNGCSVTADVTEVIVSVPGIIDGTALDAPSLLKKGTSQL